MKVKQKGQKDVKVPYKSGDYSIAVENNMGYKTLERNEGEKEIIRQER